MPITYINIEWPDKEVDKVYSPSSVIEDYFEAGNTLKIDIFLNQCNQGLNEASERVRKKFGYACTSAMAEASRISKKCKEYDAQNTVKIISIN